MARQPVVEGLEAVQPAALEPAVDHVGRAAPQPDGVGDVGRPSDDVAGGEQVGDVALKRLRVHPDPTLLGHGDPCLEGGGVGDEPDRRDHHIARHHELGALDRLRATPPRGVRLAQLHAGATHAGHLAARVADHGHRRDEELEADAFLLRVLDLGGMGGHLLSTTTVRDEGVDRAEAPRGPRRVHRHVAATDDHHALPLEVGRPVEPDVAQETEAGDHSGCLLAGHPEAGRPGRAGRQQDGVVPLALERLEVVDPRVGHDLDAERGHVADVLLDDLLGQAVHRDRLAKESAGLGRRLDDLHPVALAGELPSGGQPRRPRAHDRHALAVGRRRLDAGPVVRGVVALGDEALEPPDRQRALEVIPRALRFAGRVAGSPEGADERRRVQHELERLLVLAAADERDVAVGLDPRRAGARAGRRALAGDDRLLRHGLRKRDVGRSARDEVGVELVGHGHRAHLLALLAAGAGGGVDVPRLLAHRGVEAPRVVPANALHLAVGDRGDVRVVDRRGHLRARDAARAVQRREDLAQQDHPSTHARFLLDQQDLVAHVAELQRRLHAPDAGPDHQRVVLHAVSAPAALSLASISENSRMYVTKGSAHTEQSAAIFTRSGWYPSAFIRSCASAAIRAVRAAQSGR